jgi:hypothetical protein
MAIDQNLAAEIDSAAEATAQEMQAEREGREQVEDGSKTDETNTNTPEGKENDDESGDDPGSGEEGGRLDHSGGEGGQVDSERGDERGEEDQEGEGSEGEGSGQEARVEPEAPAGPSEDALIQALTVGIPISDAKAFSSDESLLRAVNAVRDAAAAVDSEDGGDEGSQEAEDPLAGFPELDPEEYDPNVIKAFEATKALIKTQHETIQELRSGQQESAAQSTQAAARDVEQWFDSQVAGLGDDFKETLGEGATSALTPGSPQQVKRDQIASRMATMLAGYNATGQQAPPREEVFQEAARLVLHDEFAAARERKLAKELEKRAGQHIQRPGGKKEKRTQSPFDETAEMLDNKFFK